MSDTPVAVIDPQPHWDWSLLPLSPQQKEIAADLQQWLAVYPSAVATALATQNGGNYPDLDMRILEQEIIKKFNPLPNAEKCLIVLCKMVDAINATATEKLPAPRIPKLSIREKNPYMGSIPAALQQARLWRTTISHSIVAKKSKKSAVQLSPKANIGLLFSSAVLHGALADGALLVALARALCKPMDSLALYGQRLSVELSISWQGESGSEHRFWYPDALTGTMISRLSENAVTEWMGESPNQPLSDKEVRPLIWASINTFFKESRLPSKDRPTSLGALVKVAGVDMKTRIPTVLMGYACRNLISHSPGRHVLNRLYNVTIASTLAANERRGSSDLVTSLNNHSESLDELEPIWLGRLRSCFNEDSRDKVLLALNQIVPPAGSLEACFHGFAKHLVSRRAVNGQRLALSTTKSYLVTAVKTLGGRLGDVDPATLKTETLEDLYSEILEDAAHESKSKGLRRRLAQVLQHFHEFLAKEYQVERINYREILGIGTGLVPVDANLITYDEYARIHEALPTTLSRLHPELPALNKLGEAFRLLFMLAFKCGLRRMEALMLKCNDLAEHDPAELLIRPSDARRLKTKSSTRKIPLYALLDDAEISALCDWKASRLKEYPDKQASEVFLFAIPELGNDVTTQDQIFPAIHQCMREVTGDDSLRFHHLRHSFASWTYLRLMLSDLKDIPEIFPEHPKTTAVLSEAKEFRERLYGRSDPTRRHTYAVASLLGHSGPDVSLEHYIHVCDLLFTLWRDQDESAPARRPLKIEANRPKSTFYRWVANDSSQVPVQISKKQSWVRRIIPKGRTLRQNNPDIPVNAPTSVNLEPGIFRNVWKLLYEHSFHGRALEELAMEIGIPLVTAKKMLSYAREVMERRVSRSTKGYQHRMVEMNFDRQQDERTRLPCPEEPRTAADKAIESTLSKPLSALMLKQPELCKAVFDYYIENAWNDRNELPFKDSEKPESARNFIRLLEELGLKKSNLAISSYDTSERSRNLSAWRKALELSKGYPIRKTKNKSIAARKWITIKPVFDSASENDSSEKMTSIAFRYLMVMGAIIMAGLDKDEESTAL